MTGTRRAYNLIALFPFSPVVLHPVVIAFPFSTRPRPSSDNRRLEFPCFRSAQVHDE
ncbi:hypothetical protein PUN28_009264 [Cardiocondyla obscurior]|uniref:Uncharacterized protein n=1 Tax=Cardiocondyla obscurior TaxID=286306 RepID=A0AAW2FSX2_9HYME